MEATFGADIWDTPQGDIAEDVVTLRALDRQGLGDFVFMDLIPEEDLRGLLRKAILADDRESAVKYLAGLAVRDPQRFRAALGRPASDVDLTSEDPAEPGSEDDPTRMQPLRSTKAKGQEHPE